MKNEMINKAVQSIRCHGLSGKLFENQENEMIYEATYRFWKSVYTDVYATSNHPESLNPDNFVLQDQIYSLTCESQVIGCILFSFHLSHLTVSRDIKYFQGLPKPSFEKLVRMAPNSFMLMESLTVHPEWRRSVTGISLSDVLIGLAVRVFAGSQADILIGTPRIDVKVDRILDRFGGQDIGSFSKSNYPCKVYVFDRKQTVLNPEGIDTSLINILWNNRNDQSKGDAA